MVCVGLLVAFPIGLLIGSILLRVAVGLTNACVGGGGPAAAPPDDDYSYEDYRRTRSRSHSYQVNTGVPVPDIGRGMLIMFVVWLANFGAGIVLGIALMAVVGVNRANDPKSQLMMNVVSLPIGFLITSLVHSGMLPTSFGRACLVTLFEYLIAFAIGIGIVLVFVAWVGGMGGLGGFKP